MCSTGIQQQTGYVYSKRLPAGNRSMLHTHNVIHIKESNCCSFHFIFRVFLLSEINYRFVSMEIISLTVGIAV